MEPKIEEEYNYGFSAITDLPAAGRQTLRSAEVGGGWFLAYVCNGCGLDCKSKTPFFTQGFRFGNSAYNTAVSRSGDTAGTKSVFYFEMIS